MPGRELSLPPTRAFSRSSDEKKRRKRSSDEKKMRKRSSDEKKISRRSSDQKKRVYLLVAAYGLELRTIFW